MVATAQNQDGEGAGRLRTLASQVGMSSAMERLLLYRDSAASTSNPRFWGAINFDTPSSQKRLHLFDRVDNDVTSFYCAHGVGSDKSHSGIARRFSNEKNSLCTCLGIFKTGSTYHSQANGRSLYLYGKSPENFNAFDRHIVMHKAYYVGEAYVEKRGKAGRSHGCPAVAPEHAKDIIDSLEGGSFLIHWSSRLENGNA